MEAKFMNCSGSRVSLLRLATFGLAGALVAAGCGGSTSSGGKDGGTDGPGVASLKINPGTQDFGGIAVGSTSAAPFTFTITNSGATTGTPQVSVSSTEFVLGASTCGEAIKANATCTVAVNFKPSSAGAKTGMLTVTATPGGTVSAMLNGTGLPPGALSFAPPTRDFGAVAVGDTSPVTSFTLSNPGASMAAGLAVTVNGGDFVLSNNKCMATLAAMGTCTVDVAFKPTVAGGRSGALVASAGGQTATVPLTGTGQTPAMLVVRPENQGFVSSVGSQSAPVQFTFTNQGGSGTGSLTSKLGGPNATDFVITQDGCVASVAGGASCTVSVAFKPTSAALKAATLTVSGAGMGAASATANLGGNASAVSIDPLMADFGPVNVNSTAAAKVFTVKNGGGAPTSALKASVSTAEFAIVGNTCDGVTVAPNGTCTVSVNFRPTSPGAKTAVVAVTGSGGEGAVAGLIGTGASTGLELSPMFVNFGSIGIGANADRTITVTNTGSNTTGMLTPLLGGANATQFTVLMNNCTAALAPMGTCTMVVRFSPSTANDKSATLTVTGAPGETGTANLAGSGLVGAISFSVPGMTSPAYPLTVVGQTSQLTYVISNSGQVETGMLSLTFGGPNASEFSVSSTNCMNLGPAVQCTATVDFKPTSGGSKNASLVATGVAGPSGQTALSGTSAAALELASTSKDFGTQSVGSTTASTVKLKVRGAFTTAPVPTVTGDFTTSLAVPGCGTGVNPATPATWLDDEAGHGAACVVNVSFRPVNPRGNKTGTLTLTGTGGLTTTAALTGVAGGPLSASAAPADQGTIAPGASGGPSIITVTNNGNAAATSVVANLTAGDVGEFQIVENLCTSGGMIAAGGNCTVKVAFQPTSNGAKKATLRITATEATLAEQVLVDLTGTGGTAAAAGISLSPSPGNIGNVPISGTGTVQLTFTNPMTSGGSTGTITAPTASQPGVGTEFTIDANTCGVGGGTSLNAGQSCTFTVKYDPLVGNGVRTTSSTITVATANLGTVTATVNAASIQPISITPAVGDFTSGVVGDAANGPTVDFTVSNSGAPFAGTFATVAGTGTNPQPTYFSRVTGITNDCPATIPTGTCAVRFRFVPGAPGVATARLELTGGTRLATSTLTGTGVADAQLSWVNIAASQTRNFGGVRVTTMGVPQTFTLKNTGGFKTSVMAITTNGFTGGAAVGNFPLSGTCIGMTSLDPGASCTVIANFSPGSTVGAQTANIAVTANNKLFTSAAPAQVITLSGTGVPASGAGSQYIDPASVDFGQTAPATTATTVASFTFHNTSGAAVTLAVTPIVLSDATRYSLDVTGAGVCTTGLVVSGADGTCTFKVKFNPPAGTTAAFYPATVTVAFAGGSASAGLIGRSQRAGALEVTTRPTDDGAFGDRAINVTTASRTWTITNVGEAATGAIAIATTDTTNFTTTGTCAAAAPGLAPGATCTVVMTAKPTVFTVATNTVTITGAALETTPVAVVAATVRGRTDATLSAVTPAGFGDVPLGDATPATTQKTIVVSNAPANALTTGPLGVAVDNTDYTVSGCTTERTSGIASGASCTLTVTVNTTKTGADNATLTLTTSPGGNVTVPLTANGTPSVVVSTAGVVAGASVPFAVNQERTFTVTLNPTTNPVASGALKVTITSATAGDAGLFVKTGDTCSLKSLTNVNAGTQTCTVSIKFTGTGGTHGATLTVSGTTAGNAAVATLTSP
jgi:hypothetical protein